MNKRRFSLCLALALAALACFVYPATAVEAEPWFMDFFDYQAQSAITDADVIPLYRQLIAEASTVAGERDMALFLNGFLALPLAQQERMIAGAKVYKLLDALFVWDDFVMAAHERLDEVEQLPFLRGVIAPEREALLSGEAVWTLDALRLYHGDVGEMDDWTLTPKNPRAGSFLLLSETGKESPGVLATLVENIESLSEGALRRTQDPEEATAILVYSSISSPRGSYPAYGKKVTAYAATARLKASILARPEEPPYYISVSTEPPAQAEISETQTVYYSEMPSLVDSEQLAWLVDQLVLALHGQDGLA